MVFVTQEDNQWIFEKVLSSLKDKEFDPRQLYDLEMTIKLLINYWGE